MCTRCGNFGHLAVSCPLPPAPPGWLSRPVPGPPLLRLELERERERERNSDNQPLLRLELERERERDRFQRGRERDPMWERNRELHWERTRDLQWERNRDLRERPHRELRSPRFDESLSNSDFPINEAHQNQSVDTSVDKNQPAPDGENVAQSSPGASAGVFEPTSHPESDTIKRFIPFYKLLLSANIKYFLLFSMFLLF